MKSIIKRAVALVIGGGLLLGATSCSPAPVEASPTQTATVAPTRAPKLVDQKKNDEFLADVHKDAKLHQIVLPPDANLISMAKEDCFDLNEGDDIVPLITGRLAAASSLNDKMFIGLVATAGVNHYCPAYRDQLLAAWA